MEAKLLQKYIEGNADVDEERKVTEWISASDDNRRRYMAQRKLYDISLWNTTDDTEKLMSAKYSMRVIVREVLKVAAVIAIVATATYYIMSLKYSATDDAMQSIYTPAGQRTEIRLADGTQVWLNACSRLTFPGSFSGSTRRVKLDGEGYFIVAKNKKKPFIVETNRYDIKVLGTEFNVSAYSSNAEWKTSLLNGKVAITDRNGADKMFLEPNTMAYLIGGKLQKGVINSNLEFMWRKGLMCIENLSLEQVAERLKLYYDVDIIVHNRRATDNFYTGKFRINDGVEHVLEVLRLDHKFTYTYDADKNLIIIK